MHITTLLKNRFVRDSGTLLSGNVVASGIAFLAYLVLCRLFTPEDFALYNIFYSYIEVLIILSTCKYELAIVVANSDHEASGLTRLTLWLNAVVSVVLLAVGLTLALSGVRLSSLGPQLYLLIPFMVFFCGTTRAYTFLLNRHKRYPAIATSEIITSLSGTATKILFGLLNGLVTVLHFLGLPLGTILGKVGGNIYLRHTAAKASLLPDRDHCTDLRPTARRHRNFPLYVMPKELVGSLSASLPFIWLGAHSAGDLIGLFALALTFTMRPVNILATAFEKVFYASTAQKIESHQPIRSDIRRFLLVLNAVALPVVALGFFFSEPIFTFLFGEKWVGTGYYVACIIPWLWLQLNVNSLMFVANVFSTQRYDFFFQLAQLLLRVAALWIGIHHADFRLAVLLFCGASTLTAAAQLGWYLLQIKHYEKSRQK